MVIIGAGEQRWDGWIPTGREDLDLLDRAGWNAWFGDRRANALLCEHVWEHLSEAQGRAAASPGSRSARGRRFGSAAFVPPGRATLPPL
ncbi:hypothetical protein ACFP9V_10325 [Deinococcus radiopugnans]|uniref:hypothetical protein n=1 Tax=Deinococcus radiopugnans TaxID=57497 RepID=UPI003612E5F4